MSQQNVLLDDNIKTKPLALPEGAELVAQLQALEAQVKTLIRNRSSKDKGMSTSNDWNDYKSDESESDNGIELELEEIELGTPSDTDPTAMVGIGHGVNAQQPHHMGNQKFYNVLCFFALLAISLSVAYMVNDSRILHRESVQLKHLLEHQNAEIVLVDNSNNFWNLSAGPDLTIKSHTVANTDDNKFWHSIRSSQGFSTNSTGDGLLQFRINYAEFTIGSIKGTIYILLASKDYRKIKDECNDGTVTGSYFFGINNWGYRCGSEANGTIKGMIASGELKSGFKSGDKIGVGLLVIKQSATAEAANCARCRQPNLWIFYTKNGEIWGIPKPLPANVPSLLFPTIALWRPGSVAANFGQEPFVYEIPPAKDLCVGDHCQKPIF